MYIPALVLYLSFIGYLALIILIKWSIDWTGSTSIAPSLISMIMDFALKFGDINIPLFTGQIVLSRLLFALFIGSIPVILFALPIYKM